MSGRKDQSFDKDRKEEEENRWSKRKKKNKKLPTTVYGTTAVGAGEEGGARVSLERI